jgi:hypothetical protein
VILKPSVAPALADKLILMASFQGTNIPSEAIQVCAATL